MEDDICLAHRHMMAVASKENAVFRDHLPDCPSPRPAESAAQIPFFYWFIAPKLHFLFFPVHADTFGMPLGLKNSRIRVLHPRFPDPNCADLYRRSMVYRVYDAGLFFYMLFHINIRVMFGIRNRQ
jgi:hypothetical protein